MRQVLFYIPIHIFPNLPDGLPIYGYGFMLFLAFVACIFLSSWLARKEGIPKEMLQDLAIWIFVCGILGARITFMIQYGASPRATIFLTRGAKAQAFLDSRGYVTPQDVKSIGYDVLRHRISVTYEAEAEDIPSENLLQRIFDHLKVP